MIIDMSNLKGPYEAGELGTKSVMDLGVVQVVDDVEDLESGTLATPPDASIDGVIRPASRDGMVAIVRHTGDIYQRIGGAWALVQSGQFQVVNDETDLTTSTPDDPADGMVVLVKHTGDLFRRAGGVWTRIYYAPRYVAGQPSAFENSFPPTVDLEANTAGASDYSNLVTLGPFRHAGSLPLYRNNFDFVLSAVNTEPNQKIQFVYKVSDDAVLAIDNTKGRVDNGFSLWLDLPNQNGSNNNNQTIALQLESSTATPPSRDVLAGCYLHIGIFTYNDTGGTMTVSISHSGFTIKAIPKLLQ